MFTLQTFLEYHSRVWILTATKMMKYVEQQSKRKMEKEYEIQPKRNTRKITKKQRKHEKRKKGGWGGGDGGSFESLPGSTVG